MISPSTARHCPPPPAATAYLYLVTVHDQGQLAFTPADVIAHIEDAFGNIGVNLTLAAAAATQGPTEIVRRTFLASTAM